MKYCLDGSWTLYYFREGEYDVSSPKELAQDGIPSIPATVPGNIELDLLNAGIIEDPYFGTNALKLRPFEFFEWWYVRNFGLENDFDGRVQLVVDGVDCFAEIFINNTKVAVTENALVQHCVDVSAYLNPPGEENSIAVKISSAVNAVRRFPLDANTYDHLPFTYERLWARKPAHSYGWDIAPRIMLGGIWRSIRLEKMPDVRFENLYIEPLPESNAESATLIVHYSFATADYSLEDYSIRVEGACGNSSFSEETRAYFVAGKFIIKLRNPKLWWPRDYGEQNLYHVTCSVLKAGAILAEKTISLGIRTVELDRTATAPGRFLIKVNGTPIMAKGTNWVPADALHSRDEARIPDILALVDDLKCNIIRCWGGGVYENDAFYKHCDAQGILVWQDFALACAVYPQNELFLEKIRDEAEQMVGRLRQHPSVAIWSGDNECDQAYFWMNRNSDPNTNLITRQVIPNVLKRLDPNRPYLPSSPYISKEVVQAGSDLDPVNLFRLCPEQHLWGPRNYFKQSLYSENNAHFISEIGYHGAPGVSSIRKFISEENLWPGMNNPEWHCHATDSFGNHQPLDLRIELMYKQIHEYFDHIPEALQEFVLASQICQAEAKKYFIEMVRQAKWDKTGIIWWNIMDCWPQFSDAVVDYYFNKKLAYHYIKRAQEPICIMIGDSKSWEQPVIGTNDTLQPCKGRVRINDGDSGEEVFAADFNIPANENATLGEVSFRHGEKRLLLITWSTEKGAGCNHYIVGYPGFSLPQYRNWLEKIAELDHAFRAENVGY